MESNECLRVRPEDREVARMTLERCRRRSRSVRCMDERSWVSILNLQLALLFFMLTCNCAGFAVTDRSDRAVQTSWRESSTERSLEDHQSIESYHQPKRSFVISMQTEEVPIDSDNRKSSQSEVEAHDAEESSSTSSSSSSQTEDSELLLDRRLQAQARMALMAKRGRRGSSLLKSTGKDTSVGARRLGSATRSRQSGSATRHIWDGVKKAAQGVSSTSNNSTKPKSQFLGNSGTLVAPRIPKSVVTTVIKDLLQSRGHIPVTAHSQSGTNQAAIRLATPHDDVEIANLRLSVFSDFHPDLQNQFCVRSCQAIAARRGRGATCLVATAPSRSGSSIPGMRASDIIMGSAECSWHEFCGTRLGRRRPPQAIWYVTEVAVSPSARRRRIASQLLEAIDVLAQQRRIETLYLHVDVENCAALKLYEKSGYRNVHCNGGDDDDNQLMYREFTKSLNLHPGATKGREHFLLYKNLVNDPTWLDDSIVHYGSQDGLVQSSRSNELVGILGFEIPA